MQFEPGKSCVHSCHAACSKNHFSFDLISGEVSAQGQPYLKLVLRYLQPEHAQEYFEMTVYHRYGATIDFQRLLLPTTFKTNSIFG